MFPTQVTETALDGGALNASSCHMIGIFAQFECPIDIFQGSYHRRRRFLHSERERSAPTASPAGLSRYFHLNKSSFGSPPKESSIYGRLVPVNDEPGLAEAMRNALKEKAVPEFQASRGRDFEADSVRKQYERLLV